MLTDKNLGFYVTRIRLSVLQLADLNRTKLAK